MLAVVGAGSWGRNHLRNFAELGALRAICDSNEDVLAKFRQAYPGVRAYANLDQVLSDPEIEAVVLATPASEHHRGAQAALAAGRHVLVEKPLALSVNHAEELHRMAQERCLVLMVGHLLEYHPAFVRLKGLVAAGDLGKIAYLYSSRLSFGPFGRPENVLWDLAPHDLSMILRLLGEMPESVQAAGSSCITRGVNDSAAIHLSFAGGVRAHILVSWLHPFKEQRLVVVGTEGMAVFDDVLKVDKLRLYRSRLALLDHRPAAPIGEPEIVGYATAEPLRRECEHFIRCLQTGDEPLTDGASGVEITRVLEACQRSLECSRAVSLSEPDVEART